MTHTHTTHRYDEESRLFGRSSSSPAPAVNAASSGSYGGADPGYYNQQSRIVNEQNDNNNDDEVANVFWTILAKHTSEACANRAMPFVRSSSRAPPSTDLS